MNGLDFHVAHVLNRPSLTSDASKMGVEPIVLCPGRVSVRHHVLVLVQVHAFVTLWT